MKDEIIKSLQQEFPGKNIVCNPESNISEILCEVEPSSRHSEFSEAIAYIKASAPHKHIKAVETYKVESGTLKLYLDGMPQNVEVGQRVVIKPEVIHWAKGNWARVSVRSEPGWTFEDHLLVNKAVSAGGIIIKDGKILFVRFPNENGVTFPKGHVEKNETYEQAALREVIEETGFKDLQIVKGLGMVTRPATETDGTKVIKDIHLFLMKINGERRGQAEEKTEWLSVDEALTRLTPQEAEFLKRFVLEFNIQNK